MSDAAKFDDTILSLALARVSEQAALACRPLIGRGDEKAADQAAVNAMREELGKLDIAGVVVIGEGERDEAPMLYIGEEVGTGNGPGVDIALDPLEGTTITAKAMPNALTVISMAPRGTTNVAAPGTSTTWRSRAMATPTCGAMSGCASRRSSKPSCPFRSCSARS